MIKPEIPKNEKERLAALDRYNILDTLEEKEYEGITQIASQICNTPIALISLIDEKRQWFKSHHGLNATETPREYAFCAHAINDPKEILIVPDSREDNRFQDNPLVTGPPSVVFYAGAPLNTSDGYSLGTLCVIDNQPSELTENQKTSLKALADQVMGQLELRRSNRALDLKNNEILRLNERLDAFAYRLSHDLKTPIRGIKSVVSWFKDDYADELDEQANEWMDLLHSRADYMESLTNGMLEYSRALASEVKMESFNLKDLILNLEIVCLNKTAFTVNQTRTDVTIHQFNIGIRSILQNLISNSLKFNDKDHCIIDIDLNDEMNGYTITYQDNGPGIPAQFRSKVFSIFETLNEKRPDSTGIGLATVQSITESLNGKIELTDRPDGQEGVCFVLTLPEMI